MDEDFDEQTEPINKFGILEGTRLQTQEVETDLNFHHARDREKGISEEGILFNYESISLGQEFEGTISGDETDLRNLMTTCGNEWTAYIGRSKNAQYGKARFKIIDTNPQPDSRPIKWDEENGEDEEIDEESEDVEAPTKREQKEKDKASLTFLSNTIIYNENGFPTTNVDVLEKYLGIQIIKAFVKKGEVENFVGVWQLKRPSEHCFLAGSSFLLKISEGDKTRLEAFQKNGIGERTQEGFGQCIINWQTDRDLSEYLGDRSKLKKPESPVPNRTREIIQMLVTDSIKKQVELMALEYLDQVSKGIFPPRSLIGRLLSMIKNGKRIEFIDRMGQLRKSARDKLEKCRSSTENLLEFLVNFEVNAEKVLKQPRNSNLKKLSDEIGYKPEEDVKLQEDLYQRYFVMFLSMMRKRSPQE